MVHPVDLSPHTTPPPTSTKSIEKQMKQKLLLELARQKVFNTKKALSLTTSLLQKVELEIDQIKAQLAGNLLLEDLPTPTTTPQPITRNPTRLIRGSGSGSVSQSKHQDSATATTPGEKGPKKQKDPRLTQRKRPSQESEEDLSKEKKQRCESSDMMETTTSRLSPAPPSIPQSRHQDCTATTKPGEKGPKDQKVGPGGSRHHHHHHSPVRCFNGPPRGPQTFQQRHHPPMHRFHQPSHKPLPHHHHGPMRGFDGLPHPPIEQQQHSHRPMRCFDGPPRAPQAFQQNRPPVQRSFNRPAHMGPGQSFDMFNHQQKPFHQSMGMHFERRPPSYPSGPGPFSSMSGPQHQPGSRVPFFGPAGPGFHNPGHTQQVKRW